jgi:hypothetical protein
VSENYDLLKFAPIGFFPSDLNAIEKKKFFDELTYLPPEVQDLDKEYYDW